MTIITTIMANRPKNFKIVNKSNIPVSIVLIFLLLLMQKYNSKDNKKNVI